jgi:ATP-dependent protease ClpP protease subunit
MPRYEIKAKGPTRAELRIYGDIGQSWDAEESNDAKTVVEAIGKLRGDLDVRINSFGGSVADGLAIFNALRRYDGTVTTHIDGVAYSIASLIAMAGRAVNIAENGMVMVHAPWGAAVGNAVEMREMADILDKHAEAMLSSYLRAGGPDADTVRGWLTDGQDHYFTAAEAVELGLADAISDQAPTLQIAAALLQDARRFYLPAAMSRSPEVSTMTDSATQGGSLGTPDPIDALSAHSKAVQAAVEKGIRAEAKRRQDVAAVFAGFADGDPLNPISALYDECLADVKCDELEARRKLMAALSARSADPVIRSEVYGAQPGRESRHLSAVYGDNPQIQAGRDGGDALVRGLTEALLIRAGVEKDADRIKAAHRNEFLGYDFRDIARAMLRAQGIAAPTDKYALFRKAIQASGVGQGSDNFANILENVASKAALDGFMAADETWQTWCQVGSVPDFKTASRVNLSLFGTLDELDELQQYEHGQFTDLKESITAVNHGKKYSISLEALTNDDIGILSRIPTAMGEAANRTIGDAVYYILKNGTTLTLNQDSRAIFEATYHKNYVTSGAAPSTTTVAAGLTAMATQTDPSGATLGIRPKFLIHPVALWGTVYPLLNSAEITTSNVGAANPVVALGLIPVMEHRLDLSTWTTHAGKGWFLAAARNTIEVAFVGGQRTPQLERTTADDVDGVVWKVRLPFGAACLDYRGLYFNDGQ